MRRECWGQPYKTELIGQKSEKFEVRKRVGLGMGRGVRVLQYHTPLSVVFAAVCLTGWVRLAHLMKVVVDEWPGAARRTRRRPVVGRIQGHLRVVEHTWMFTTTKRSPRMCAWF